MGQQPFNLALFLLTLKIISLVTRTNSTIKKWQDIFSGTRGATKFYLFPANIICSKHKILFSEYLSFARFNFLRGTLYKNNVAKFDEVSKIQCIIYYWYTAKLLLSFLEFNVVTEPLKRILCFHIKEISKNC